MIYVFHPGSMKIDERLRSLPWAYLGSGSGFRQASAILDNGKRRFLGKEIEEVSGSCRELFIDHVGKLSSLQPDKLLWYSTSLASKSISRSDIFQQYVYLTLLRKLSSEGKDMLFISDDKELLGNIAAVPGAVLRSRAGKTLKERYSEALAVYRRGLKYLLLWFLSRSFASARLKAPCVLIYSPLDNRVFKGSGGFNDNYFGDLASLVSGSGYAVYRVIPLDAPISQVLEARRRFKGIIHPFSYISLFRLIKTLFTRLKIRTGVAAGEDVLLEMLTRKEIKKEARLAVYQSYLLHYYAYRSINGKASPGSSFVYIFENQPWEKMVNMALQDFRRIGYQHTVISSNWLDYRVSAFEKDMPLPSVILASGEKWLEFLKKYYGKVVTENAGSIRLGHIWRSHSPANEGGSGDIVVALPYYPGIALSLQRLLLKELKEQSSLLCGHSIKIKPHPYLREDAVLREEFKRFSNVSFISGDLGGLLKKAELLVTSSSTVVFDSACSGCKTLYFVPEELSEGTEFFIREHIFLAYENDFGRVLRQALESKEFPQLKVDEYFSKPDYGKFMEYIAK